MKLEPVDDGPAEINEPLPEFDDDEDDVKTEPPFDGYIAHFQDFLPGNGNGLQGVEFEPEMPRWFQDSPAEDVKQEDVKQEPADDY